MTQFLPNTIGLRKSTHDWLCISPKNILNVKISPPACITSPTEIPEFEWSTDHFSIFSLLWMFRYAFLVCLRNPACSPFMEGADDWNHAARFGESLFRSSSGWFIIGILFVSTTYVRRWCHVGNFLPSYRASSVISFPMCSEIISTASF